MQAPGRTNLGASLLSGLVGLAALLRLTACADSGPPTSPTETSKDADRPVAPSAVTAAASVTLVGAGDIAHCGSNQGDEKTAAIINGLLVSNPGLTVFAAGDVVYESATASEFTNCYQPSWGAFKTRTRPALGNHEYNISPNPYFDYFGAAAGERGKGYYSYNRGAWHIVVLNSNIATKVGSAQDTWLKADLAATSQPCILAYWHHARFASGVNSTTPIVQSSVKPFWDALYAVRADVVVVGHQHFYERFAPQTPDGRADSQNGIVQFVVGTGGRSKGGSFQATAPNSRIRNIGTFGVLKLTLNASGYDWKFLPEAGKSFTDAGKGTCHPKT